MIFAIRDKVRWEGLPYRERGGVPRVHARSQELFKRYQLHRLSRIWSVATYQEVLGPLDLLDRLPAEIGGGGSEGQLVSGGGRGAGNNPPLCHRSGS